MTHTESLPETPQMTSQASAGGEAEVQITFDYQIGDDLRFADPLVAEIVEVWRLRQDFHRAEKRLTLQIKSICGRYCGGNKVKAEQVYKAAVKGETDPGFYAMIAPLFSARGLIEQERAAKEKTLKRMAKDLPVYPWVQGVKGFGELGLAATVGECGDLSKYRSVAAVWKRTGLAVINGGRQRRVSGEAALEHGYAPERRAVFWTLADSLLKAQGKDEKAGPYRQFYDAEKARQRPRVETDGHAHNRAMRHMMKRLLRDLTVAWREIDRGRVRRETHGTCAPVDQPIAIAAE